MRAFRRPRFALLLTLFVVILVAPSLLGCGCGGVRRSGASGLGWIGALADCIPPPTPTPGITTPSPTGK